jgi:hypothetical protein
MTNDYGMFTDEGNARVHDIVEIALLGKMRWSSVEKMLEDLSTFDKFREASQDAVLDKVFVFLARSPNWPDGAAMRTVDEIVSLEQRSMK